MSTQVKMWVAMLGMVMAMGVGNERAGGQERVVARLDGGDKGSDVVLPDEDVIYSLSGGEGSTISTLTISNRTEDLRFVYRPAEDRPLEIRDAAGKGVARMAGVAYEARWARYGRKPIPLKPGCALEMVLGTVAVRSPGETRETGVAAGGYRGRKVDGKEGGVAEGDVAEVVIKQGYKPGQPTQRDDASFPLTVVLKPTSAVYRLSEPMPVEIGIRNNSGLPITIESYAEHPHIFSFEFHNRRRDGEAEKDQHIGVLVTPNRLTDYVTLLPGETLWKSVDMRGAFETAGVYEVAASFVRGALVHPEVEEVYYADRHAWRSQEVEVEILGAESEESAGVSRGDVRNGEAAWSMQYMDIPEYVDRATIEAVGKALGVEKVALSGRAHMAPTVMKAMLIHPELVSRDYTNYDIVEFGDEAWGRSRWNAVQMVENTDLPDALPLEERERVLKEMDPGLRDDPKEVERAMRIAYEYYVAARAERMAGSLEVEMCVGPNARAALEYLVVRLGGSTKIRERTVLECEAAARDGELGDASYVFENGRIGFIRDNVAVVIESRGGLTVEAAGLARVMDALVKIEPVMTEAELASRRPRIEVGERSLTEGGGRAVTCTVKASDGDEIVKLVPMVDGQYKQMWKGLIFLPREKSQATVKVVVVTKGLLADVVEKKVEAGE